MGTFGRDVRDRMNYPSPPDASGSESMDILLDKIQKVLTANQFDLFQFRVLVNYAMSGFTRRLRYGEGSKMKKSYSEFLGVILKLRQCLHDPRLTEMMKFAVDPEEEHQKELQSEFHRFDDIAHRRFSKNIDR